MREGDIEIREATEEDLPALLGLYGQLGLDDGQVLSVEKALRIFRRMASYPDYRVYLAVRDGRAVGTLALLIMDNLAHLGEPSAVLEDMVVATSERNRGVGGRLVRFAMETCRQKGCYKLSLTSNQHREAAHRFYESLGFRRHGYSFWVDLKS